MSAAWGEDHFGLIVMGNGRVRDEEVGEPGRIMRPGSGYVYSLMSEQG
jgi:hypothetical protein